MKTFEISRFRSYQHIFVKCGFKHYADISNNFNSYKKIHNSFLNFDHSLLMMITIIEIGQIFPAEKRVSKT